MTPNERQIYRKAAQHAAMGWSRSKSGKHLGFPHGCCTSGGRFAARQGFSDMRTHLDTRNVLAELAAPEAPVEAAEPGTPAGVGGVPRAQRDPLRRRTRQEQPYPVPPAREAPAWTDALGHVAATEPGPPFLGGLGFWAVPAAVSQLPDFLQLWGIAR